MAIKLHAPNWPAFTRCLVNGRLYDALKYGPQTVEPEDVESLKDLGWYEPDAPLMSPPEFSYSTTVNGRTYHARRETQAVHQEDVEALRAAGWTFTEANEDIRNGTDGHRL